MSKKYTNSHSTAKAWECCNKKCKWQGLESEKATIEEDAVSKLVCPTCGEESFYGLLEEPVKKPSLFYIQNRDAGFMGNAIVFWRKGRCGYTADLDNSELFSEAEAKKICLGSPKKNLAWPQEYIDNNKGIQRIVDSQYIFSEHIKIFES